MFAAISTFGILVVLGLAAASLAVPLDGAAPTRNDYVGDAEHEQILAQLRDEAQHSIRNPADYVSDGDFDRLMQRLAEEASSSGAAKGDVLAEEVTTPTAPVQSTTENQVSPIEQLVETTSRPKKSGGGSSTSSDRLMKELKKIHKSELHKKGLYTVELVDENLYDWRVKLSAALIDDESRLHKDLVELGKQGKNDKIELSFTFGADYPFSPPFVRTIYPVLNGISMFQGGTICMDLFTPHGWSSAYMIEGAIVQVAERLAALEAWVTSTDPADVAKYHSPHLARVGYAEFLRMHPEWK